MKAGAVILLLLLFALSTSAQKVFLKTWTATEGSFTWDAQVKRSSQQSIRLHNDSHEQRSGVMHTIELNQTKPVPLRISAWSRAKDVSGSADAGYSLYIDLHYTDGTPEWGLISPFSTGTHDWERREVLVIPRKPIARVYVHLLLRNHAGTVWFDDVQMETLQNKSAVDMQLTQVPTVKAGKTSRAWGSTNDLQVHFDEAGLVTHLSLRGKPLPKGAMPGGWYLRDMRQSEKLLPFTGKWTSRKPLMWLGKAGDVRLQVRYEQQGAMLQATATLSVPEGSADRAVSLIWAMPIELRGAMWHHDIRESTAIETGELANLVRVNAGANSMMSLYPVACVSRTDWCLAWGSRMDAPRLVRLFANPQRGWACTVWDCVLSGKTRKFPHRAEHHLLLWSAEPKWGFRSAWQKYVNAFPDWFRNRVPVQGVWMPFTAPHTVEGVQDFGFAFHEGDDSIPQDDQLGILSFRYTEPMSFWMPMPKEFPRTDEGAMQCLQKYADGELGSEWLKSQARATLKCSVTDQYGRLYRQILVAPWNDGAMFLLNPDPDLPSDAQNPSKAYINFPPEHASRAYRGKGNEGLDGEYLDSLEMGADMLNFRAEHFATVDVPLVFDTGTHRPAILLVFSTWEYTRYAAEQMRKRGKYLFANGVPWRFPFLCALLDISGTETNWWQNGVWQPVSPSMMNLWRTVSYRKPYVILMNTDYESFAGQVERYFQRSLFWGIYPSMFSHNAADDPYWQNPRWYNRDRPLFKKYVPLIRRVAEAGWHPITHASAEGAWVERFGTKLFTLFNPDSTAREVKLLISLRALGQAGAVQQPSELVHGLPLYWKVEAGVLRINLTLQPEQAAVISW